MKILKPRLLRKLVASAVLVPLAFAIPVPAFAAGSFVAVSLSQQTGTAPFDADNNAGHDSSPTNNIVRTNDTVTYGIEVTAGVSKVPDTTIHLYVPKGEEVEALPPYCLPGSSISPALPEPSADLTADSWKALTAQTAKCVIGDLPAASTQAFKIVSKVRPEVPHGTRLSASRAVVKSGSTSMITNYVSHQVSAKASYDMSVGMSTTPNGARMWGPSQDGCPTPTGDKATESCYNSKYLAFMLSVPVGGKGNTPLKGDFTYSIDLSARGVYGEGITKTAAWKAAGTTAEEKFRPVLEPKYNFCLTRTYAYYGPHTGTGATPYRNDTVRNSGTTRCNYNDKTGLLTVRVSGADTTAWTYPTRTADGGQLPVDRAIVYTQSLNVSVKLAAIKAIGTKAANAAVWDLPQTIRVSEIQATSLNGDKVVSSAFTKNWNNHKTTNISAREGVGWGSSWNGVPGTRGNTEPRAFNPDWAQWVGLPGQGSKYSGDGVLLDNQVGIVGSLANFQTVKDGTSTQQCHTWDNSHLWLAAGDYAGYEGEYNTGYFQSIPSDGKAVWISGQTSYTGGADSRIEVQYGSGTPGSAAESSCANADSPSGWFDDPAKVPGNDPAEAAKGNYTAVNRVRALFYQPEAGTSWVNISMALRYNGTLEIGQTLPFWATAKVGLDFTNIKDAFAAWNPNDSTYSPGATSEDPQTGAHGGRALVGGAVARLGAEVKSRDGKWSSSTPAYTSGENVDFRFTPTVNTPIDTDLTFPTALEACLPEGIRYASASVTPGYAERVPAGQKRGIDLECVPGETYVSWELGRQQANTPIEPIVLTTKISDYQADGQVSIRGSVTVEGDPSPANVREATAGISVISASGTIVINEAASSIVELNADKSMINPRDLQWKFGIINRNSPADVYNIDVVEVLPRNGYGGSSFTGSFALDAVKVVTGDHVTVKYTTKPDLVMKADNLPNTVESDWKTLTASTPLANVTGLRVQRPGILDSGKRVEVSVSAVPLANHAGDIYEIETSGRADGALERAVRSLDEITVVESLIGDTLWTDLDADGIQGDTEKGLPGYKVSLTGSDYRGNEISPRTATTDKDGKFLFDGLASGNYEVDFGKAALNADKWQLTGKRAGDRTNDSAADPDTGIAQVALSRAHRNLNVDAGVTTRISMAVQTVVKGRNGKDPVYVSPLEKFTYVFTIENTGDQPLTSTTSTFQVKEGVTVSNVAPAKGSTVPAGFTAAVSSDDTVSAIGKLQPGEKAQYEFVGTVDKSAPDTREVKSTTTGKGTWTFGTTQATCAETCSESVIVAYPHVKLISELIAPKPDRTNLRIDDPNGDDGDDVGYRYSVINTGKIPITGLKVAADSQYKNTLVTDNPAAAQVGATNTAPLLPGKTRSMGTSKHRITQDDVDWGAIDFRATADAVSSASGFKAKQSALVDEHSIDQHESLALASTITDDSGDGTAQKDEDLIFRYRLVNTGNVTLKDIDVQDALDKIDAEGITKLKLASEHDFDGMLAPKEMVTFLSTEYRITAADLAFGSVESVSTGHSKTRRDLEVESNKAQALISTPSLDGLDLVKRVKDQDGDGFAKLTEQLTYTFTLTNNGDRSLHSVKLGDEMLEKAKLFDTVQGDFDGTLKPRESITFEAPPYVVKPSDITKLSVTNVATASGVDSEGRDRTSNESTVTIPTATGTVIIETGSGAGVEQMGPMNKGQVIGSLLILAGFLLTGMLMFRKRKD